ncbi:MAG TPA: hypothetical protein ACFYEJ_09665 [Candidatus Wujingus californicus]|uniref:hypothetical protein n=1 Tax=Candidatus Wujingus californicus TaxID=3367618 RepID=UPI0027134589|nr:hypothetical protein [Candidatus Brocadiales bacterium]
MYKKEIKSKTFHRFAKELVMVVLHLIYKLTHTYLNDKDKNGFLKAVERLIYLDKDLYHI